MAKYDFNLNMLFFKLKKNYVSRYSYNNFSKLFKLSSKLEN